MASTTSNPARRCHSRAAEAECVHAAQRSSRRGAQAVLAWERKTTHFGALAVCAFQGKYLHSNRRVCVSPLAHSSVTAAVGSMKYGEASSKGEPPPLPPARVVPLSTMSQRPSAPPSQPKPPVPPHEDKPWLFVAYRIARKHFAPIPLTECRAVSWDVARTVALALERLDALEGLDAFEALRKPPNWHFQQSRLFVAALGHLDRLYRHAQEPPLKGEELWRRAIAVRDGLRKLLDRMKSDGFFVEDLDMPRRRGNSARSVGNELLELVHFGRDIDSCLEEYDKDYDVRLIDARLQAERLLTGIGDRDAPSITRELRDEHRRACEAFAREWNGLRGLLAAHGCDGHEVERLAPAL